MGALDIAFDYPLETLWSGLSFLTVISFVLVLLSPWTYPHIHLLSLTLAVMLGSLYVSVLGPAKYVVPVETRDGPKKLILQDFDLYIYDLTMHIAPFIYIWVVYGTYYTSCDRSSLLIGTWLLILLYTLVVDIKKKYVLEAGDVNVLYGIGAVVFVVMYMSCHGG
jgi:hypothetical protein